MMKLHCCVCIAIIQPMVFEVCMSPDDRLEARAPLPQRLKVCGSCMHFLNWCSLSVVGSLGHWVCRPCLTYHSSYQGWAPRVLPLLILYVVFVNILYCVLLCLLYGVRVYLVGLVGGLSY